MAGDAIVARPSPGAGRHMEYFMDGEWGTDINTWTARNGVPVNTNVSTSNLGIPSPAGLYWNDGNLDGAPQYVLRGGVKFVPGVRPHLVRPVADFKWAQGLKAWGCVMQWFKNVTPGTTDYQNPDNVNPGLFNGFSVQQQEFADIIVNASGFGVSNRAGVWTFVSRGTGGLEAVSVQALCGPVDTPNKFEFQYRHATASDDASLTLFVNDRRALVRTFPNSHAASLTATMPWPDAVAADCIWYPQFANRSPALGNQASGGGQTLGIRDRVAYSGFDTPGL
jgi:hypothetical protein